jgi:hypothetical protein
MLNHKVFFRKDLVIEQLINCTFTGIVDEPGVVTAVDHCELVLF